MTVEVDIPLDFKSITKEMLVDIKKDLERAMLIAKRDIITRTKGQRDVHGSSFDGLTEKYKKYKIKHGRRGVPNLTLSGHMLESIDTEVKETSKGLVGRIFFNNADAAAKAQGNLKTRDFFGLSEAQVNKIKETIKG